MRKKVIDIYPPSKCDDKKEKDYIVIPQEKKSKKRSFLPIFFLFFAVAGYFYYVSFKTEVVIYPITERVQLEEDVLIRTIGSIGQNEIRGVVFSERVSDRKKFEVEGRRMLEKKTVGEINVCQDYRDTAVLFVEGTRFISDGGKIFFATSLFNLPSKQINEGCSVVEVVAAEAGEDYNISTDSKFALPGLQGSSIYGNVKGVSFTIKEKGVLKEVPYLDDETMLKAENQMKEELLAKGRDILVEKYKEEYLIDSDVQYSIEVIERDLVDEDENNFYFNLDVNIKVIALGKKDVNNFIAELLSEDNVWREDTEELNITFTRINFEEGEADALIEFAGDVYQEIDKEEWAREIIGLDFSEAKKLMEDGIEAEDIVLKTRPFGLNKVAGSLQRIKIMLQFDKN